MLWDANVHADDQERTGGQAVKLVKLNDVFFALHAAFWTLMTLLQVVYYGGSQPLGRITRLGLTITVSGLALQLAGTMVLDRRWDPSHGLFSANLLTWLGFCMVTSYVKLVVSVIKYIPQALLNTARKSTEGWSIENIILDISGGMLSLAQLLLDAYIEDSISDAVQNPVKLVLSLVSIGFDVLFILQHYCFYAHPRVHDVGGEREGMLSDHT